MVTVALHDEHAHHSGSDPLDSYTQEYWDARYGSADRIWSGNPNPRLVEHVAAMAPGRALDVGCGEGADAIWLATQGWDVTAIDVSAVALERAAARAAEAGSDVAARISWQRADVLSWAPPAGQFDLVSAQFMHLPRTLTGTVYSRLGAAVRLGGALLVVGHDHSDMQTAIPRPARPDIYFTAGDILAALAEGSWDAEVNAVIPRSVTDADGAAVTIHDTVLLARRNA